MNTVNYKGTNEVLHITRYHLLLVLERLEKQKPKFPSLEHTMIPFSVLIPTLITLLTAEFKVSLGLSADIWQAFVLTLTVSSALMTAVFLGTWIKNRGHRRPKTPEQIVEEIIEEMERQRKKVA